MHATYTYHRLNAQRDAAAKSRPTPTLDDLVMIEDHGSIVLLTPRRADVRRWLKNHGGDAPWYRRALAVSPRYVQGVLDALTTTFITPLPESR